KSAVDVRTLAEVSHYAAALCVQDSIFILPTLLPKRNIQATEEFFTVLADCVCKLWDLMRDEVPAWAQEYKFAEEAALVEKRDLLSQQMSETDAQLARMNRLKRVLVAQSETLVDAVIDLFATYLPLRAVKKEDFREDLQIVDDKGNVVAVA